MLNYSKKLEESREYTSSKLWTKSQEVLTEISEIFKPYTEMYLKCFKREISKEEFLSQLKEMLSNKTGQELEELNNLHKMLSKYNCGWSEYKASHIVHFIILELFFNEDNTLSIDQYIEIKGEK